MKTPFWFWFFAVPFMVLGVLGMLQVTSILSPELPEPAWAKVAYILGIVGFFIGGILLCLRRRSAILFLAISAIGFLGHRLWLFLLSDIVGTLAPFAPVTLFLAMALDLAAIWILTRGAKSEWVS